jgi:pimeloyl-ACP methyl ester carboxylesterase
MFERNHKMSSRFMPRLEKWLRRPRLRRLLLGQVVARGERISPSTALELIQNSVNCSVYFELMDAIMTSGPPTSFDGIDCPVTLVWGTRDRILPKRMYSQRLRDMLPGATWVELRGLGHCPMSDDPELVARTIASAARASGPSSDEMAHQSFTVA